MTVKKWLNCRLRDVKQCLSERKHDISIPVICRLLATLHYSLRANVKRFEGKQHPDRDTQFRYLREQQAQHMTAGQPVISVDTKKKEQIGNFKNAGRTWGTEPEQVNVYDFPELADGRAVPYGIYDLQHNRGTVYVGQSADTPAFAVDNIARWWEANQSRFHAATRLLIEADCGGSNHVRSHLWKQQLQEKVADRFHLEVTVSHYPPGASKWNPIEHRLFSEISKTWAGCPLRSFETVLHYIRETKTSSGLAVEAHLITDDYPTGASVPPEVMAALDLHPHTTCPQWNYTIRPRVRPSPS
jgi:hypothetical protein